MDDDDNLSRRASDDPLTLLARQDLDRFSVAELEARIADLNREVERTKQKLSRAVNHRASADALFRK
ncbi:MAG: hypothetical protein B7Z41_03435 [Rhizobiales bacterium 12-66-7]|nr:MAG: hypothetical protein B7Z41_03435 [Rhizobiales bacterium 12-66-7]